MGYPLGITHQNGNECNNNLWSFAKTVEWMKLAAMEYGMKIIPADEGHTSITCSQCGERGTRPKQGLFACPHCGLTINADLNAALNLARKLGYRLEPPKKVEVFVPTHNGIKTLRSAQPKTLKRILKKLEKHNPGTVKG